MSTYIEVMEYGDGFYTKCIMASDDKFRKKSLLDEFYLNSEYKSNVGLSEIELAFVVDDFIEFLVNKGFKKLDTIVINFSD